MYHPTRGGVRGGRDQFNWDDVKVDKHRENYLGHSIKAPVGRWQKGKDLHWYTRDKKYMNAELEAAKEEIKRIKEEEEQTMREALGLAPKRASHPQGNRLDKHEYSELVKRESTAEDAGGGHAEAARVDGLGFTRAPRPWMEPSSSVPTITDSPPKVEESSMAVQPTRKTEEEDESEDEKSRRKRRRREEKKQERWERREKRHSHASDDRKTHRKDKQRRRHDSD